MNLQLEWIIFLIIFLPLSIVLILWLSSHRDKKDDIQLKREKVWECEICYGVYTTDSKEEISKCPFCGSYNKKEAVSF